MPKIKEMLRYIRFYKIGRIPQFELILVYFKF